MRRIEAPGNLRLGDLHDIFQDVLGWADSHLHEFHVKGIGFDASDPGWGFGDDLRDTRKAILMQALEDTDIRTFKYLQELR